MTSRLSYSGALKAADVEKEKLEIEKKKLHGLESKLKQQKAHEAKLIEESNNVESMYPAHISEERDGLRQIFWEGDGSKDKLRNFLIFLRNQLSELRIDILNAQRKEERVMELSQIPHDIVIKNVYSFLEQWRKDLIKSIESMKAASENSSPATYGHGLVKSLVVSFGGALDKVLAEAKTEKAAVTADNEFASSRLEEIQNKLEIEETLLSEIKSKLSMPLSQMEEFKNASEENKLLTLLLKDVIKDEKTIESRSQGKIQSYAETKAIRKVDFETSIRKLRAEIKFLESLQNASCTLEEGFSEDTGIYDRFAKKIRAIRCHYGNIAALREERLTNLRCYCGKVVAEGDELMYAMSKPG